MKDPSICPTLPPKSAYWQVEIAKWDRERNISAIIHISLQLICMTFELEDMRRLFQCKMDLIPHEVYLHLRLAHLGDIVIFWKIPDAHIKRIRHVLTLLLSSGVTTKFQKCAFFSNTISYGNHVIHPTALAKAQHTIGQIGHLAPQRILQKCARSWDFRRCPTRLPNVTWPGVPWPRNRTEIN